MADHRLDHAYRIMVDWAREALGIPARRPLFQRRSPQKLSGEPAEAAAASKFSPTNVVGALRQAGLEPDVHNMEWCAPLALEWVDRFVVEHHGFDLDAERMRLRVSLRHISKTSVFTGTNALRHAMEEYKENGQVRSLEYGAREARRATAAAGSWAAAVDIAELKLGEGDSEVTELREALRHDLSELEDVLAQNRHLLEEHGLAEGLFPEVS